MVRFLHNLTGFVQWNIKQVDIVSEMVGHSGTRRGKPGVQNPHK